MTPLLHLLLQIGRRLSAERRIGGPDPLAVKAVARGAGRQVPLRVPEDVQPRRKGYRKRIGNVAHARVMGAHQLAFARRQALGDPVHFGMLAPTVLIGEQLPLKISKVEAGETRRSRPVAEAVEPMAGEAGVAPAGAAAAQRHQFPGRAKPIDRARVDRSTGRCQEDSDKRSGSLEGVHAGPATCGRAHRFRGPTAACTPSRLVVLPLLLLAGACKPPPEQRQFMPIADVEAGRRAIERVGCAACHSIRGIDWPEGKVGPPLEGFAHRALIAGRVPNKPELLARFVRNAPEVIPDTTMPPMPLTVEESRNVAAYLYEIGGR